MDFRMEMSMFQRLDQRTARNLEQRQEMKLEQRKKLEQKLSTRLEQQISHKTILKQYLEQEDFIHKLVRWADKHRGWKKYEKNGFDFNYAAVPYDLAQPIADKYGLGFSHCLFNPFEALILGKKVALARGTWTLFVVNDKIPKEFVDFVAIHERGEELSLGNHYFASQLEFALARKKNKMNKYMSYLDSEMPSKFIDLTQKVVFPILPEELINEIQSHGSKNPKELAIAEKLIEKYPLHNSVLRLMDRYGTITDNITEKIKKNAGEAQSKLIKLMSISAKENMSIEERINDAVRIANNTLTLTLNEIELDEARVVSKLITDEAIRTYEVIVGESMPKERGYKYVFPDSFASAYQDMLCKRQLVSVIKPNKTQ